MRGFPADLARMVASVGVEAQYEIDLASAEETFHKARSLADLEWTQTVAGLEVALHLLNEVTPEQQAAYQQAVAAADALRTGALAAAARARAESVGDAQIRRATALGDAQISHAGLVGAAWSGIVGGVNAAESSFATTASLAENLWTGSASGAASTLAAALAVADQGLVNGLGVADVAFQAALGAANVVGTRSVAEARSEHAVAVLGAELNGIVGAQSSLLAHYSAAQVNYIQAAAQARLDWMVWLKQGTAQEPKNHYAEYAAAMAQADADYETNGVGAQAGLDNAFAAHDVAFVGAAALLEAVHWTGTTSEWLGFEDALVGRLNTHAGALQTAENGQRTSLAESSKLYAIEVAEADMAYQLALLANDPNASPNHEAAIQQAKHNRTVRQADAEMLRAIDVAVADAAFDTGYAGDAESLVGSLAGLDTSLNVDWAAQAKALDMADAASLAGYWNQLEGVTSARYLGESTARAEFRYADYAARADALVTMDGTLNPFDASYPSGNPLAWSRFLADFAGAERDWWGSQKGFFLGYVGDVNGEAQVYQLIAGAGFVGMAGSIAVADVAWTATASVAAAGESVETAGAEADYLRRHAGAEREWRIAYAGAIRDEAVTGTCPTALLEAAGQAYRAAEDAAAADREVGLAQAHERYVDLVYAADVVWEGSKNLAVKSYRLTEALSWRNMKVGTATLDAGYAVQESDSYADAIELLASSRPTPWAELEAEESRARAIDVAARSAEELGNAIAAADAELAEAQEDIAALQLLNNAQARATAQREETIAAAATTRAEDQRDVINTQAAAGASATTSPESVEPGTQDTPVLDAAADDTDRQSVKVDFHQIDWENIPLIRDEPENPNEPPESEIGDAAGPELRPDISMDAALQPYHPAGSRSDILIYPDWRIITYDPQLPRPTASDLAGSVLDPRSFRSELFHGGSTLTPDLSGYTIFASGQSGTNTGVPFGPRESQIMHNIRVAERRSRIFRSIQDPVNRARMAKVISILDSLWKANAGMHVCFRWVEEAARQLTKLDRSFWDNEDYKIEMVEYNFKPVAGWSAHAMLRITIKKTGEVFYFDDGVCGDSGPWMLGFPWVRGGVAFPDEIPANWRLVDEAPLDDPWTRHWPVPIPGSD